MPDEASLPPGSIIAHYRLEGKIGAGGMGEVYRAQDTTLHRPVAIKVLSAGVLESVDKVRRFVQEARAASALNHPNIVTIYEIGQARLELPTNDAARLEISKTSASVDSIHYIAMEFIEGETLRSAIKNQKDVKTLLAILTQVADGLAKAHNAGIIHRDLKPDNIMITSDGFAKVVDFGLAKLTEKSPGAASAEKTQDGMVMGTIGYMSPEQVQGTHVDERADIFALGCILYEIVAGKRPFQSDSVIDTMHKIIFSEAPAIAVMDRSLSPDMLRIIDRCLVKDPEGRYPSVRELAADLRKATSQIVTVPPDQDSPTVVIERSPLALEGSPAATVDETALPRESGARAPIHAKAASRSFPIGAAIRWTLILSLLAGAAYAWRSFPTVGSLADEQGRTAAAAAAAQRSGAADFAWASSANMTAALRRGPLVTQDPRFFERPVPRTYTEWNQALRQGMKQRKIDVLPSPLTVRVAEQLYFRAGNPFGRAESWLAAWPIERLLTRKQIVELYLNSAPIGDTVGVEAASRKFFSKSASEITLRQSAGLLASIGKPSANPADPAGAVADEQQRILETMKEAGYLAEPKTAGTKSKKSGRVKSKNADPVPAAEETSDETANDTPKNVVDTPATPPPAAGN